MKMWFKPGGYDLEAWYDHVLGAPLIYADATPGSMVYINQPAWSMRQYHWQRRGYQPITDQQWRALYR
jgi:hypothetical protein